VPWGPRAREVLAVGYAPPAGIAGTRVLRCRGCCPAQSQPSSRIGSSSAVVAGGRDSELPFEADGATRQCSGGAKRLVLSVGRARKRSCADASSSSGWHSTGSIGSRAPSSWCRQAARPARLRILAVAERTAPPAERLGRGRRGPARVAWLGGLQPTRFARRLAELSTASGAQGRPIMLTGDHASTARAIGNELGSWENSLRRRALELTDPELDACLSRVSIFARIAPAQKVRVVRARSARVRWLPWSVMAPTTRPPFGWRTWAWHRGAQHGRGACGG